MWKWLQRVDQYFVTMYSLKKGVDVFLFFRGSFSVHVAKSKSK